MSNTTFLNKLSIVALCAALVTLSAGQAQAANLVLTDSPLFLSAGVPPMNMLVMGRDHKLYYEAYNDHSDLNNDGVLDTKYKPAEINYYGYFDSFKCYDYTAGVFVPASETANKKCTAKWSGDFLNYLTMTRLDALRKVLYGGYRYVDTSDKAAGTILQRSYVPQDAHSWGKEYSSTDGYLITDYTPLPMPAANTRHLFANTTPLTGLALSETPRMRYLLNRTERIWNWVSKERPVAGDELTTGKVASFDGDLIVRVRVCDAASTLALEKNCLPYSSGNAKPTGLLQEYGENDGMLFGLLTGSYLKNTSGGVLRRTMGSMKDEIDLTNGTFKAYDGILTTLNRLNATGFQGNYEYKCGFAAAARVITEGECQMWGNPVAEMMYESLRYFAGKGAPKSDYAVAFGAGEEGDLPGGGLPVAAWDNPYASPRPVCTKPFETVISDINGSYDTDQLPGTAFGSYADTGGIAGLNVAAEGDTIWNAEMGGSRKIFIGQSGALYDNAPTAKDADSFGNIRGLAPEEPTKQGGYYPGSVAYYGHRNDINSAAGDQKLNTFAVALASPLPKIEIPVNGRKITLVPFAKSVNGAGINANGAFQPTDQIVDFYVDTLTPTSGRFRVNFEDVEQGADHDMDAITVYEYKVVGNTVEVTLTSEYAFGGITQHMGYVISGTTADGIYLEVLDQRDGDTANDVDYFLDTPPAFTGTPPAPNSGIGQWNDGLPLPFVATRTFQVGSTGGAEILKDPLWYAAKWGGYTESGTVNDKPDLASEWDTDGDGQPDNYFLVTNALTLSQQLSKAFADIIQRVASGSSASVNSGSITSQSKLFQAKFNSGNWTGQVLAYPIAANGALASTPAWDAAKLIPAATSRNIVTVNSNGVAVPMRWPTATPNSGIDATRQHQLDSAVAAPWNTTLETDRLNYIRGDAAEEASNGGLFRSRTFADAKTGIPAHIKLGDVINSSPVFVGRPSFTYRDSLEAAPYSTFRSDNATRTPMVYVGANDGMLHGFNADTGTEVFGFVPGAVFGNLKALTGRGYAHKFFVDGTPTVGDAYFDGGWKTVLAGGLNSGGQSVFALNITDPSKFTEGHADYDSSADPNGMVLWEFSDANDVDMGFSYSQPLIVRTKSSNTAQRWVAIFGNGYNNTAADGNASTTGNAVLYVVDVATGALITKITTNEGMAKAYSGGKPNGLASPTATDLDGDGVIESVYAGDLYGNLWKFNFDDTNTANWGVANGGTAIFVAKDSAGNRQSITSQVRVTRGPGSTGAVVSFGTGRFLEPTDKSDTSTQSLYGIYDSGTAVARSDLLQQTIVDESTQTVGTAPVEVRVTSNNQLSASNRGWYLDLLTPPNPPGTKQGERMIANPKIRNGRVLFVTIVPGSDPCAPGGKTRLTELDVNTGSRLDQSPFDLNGDGKVDDADFVEILVNGVVQRVPVSSVVVSVDYGTSPGIIAGNNTEIYYVSGDDQDRTGPDPFLNGDDIVGVVGSPGDNAHGRQSWRQIR